MLNPNFTPNLNIDDTSACLESEFQPDSTIVHPEMVDCGSDTATAGKSKPKA